MTKEYRHRGYSLTQASWSGMCIITDKNGRVVHLENWSKPITKQEAYALIDTIIMDGGNA